MHKAWDHCAIIDEWAVESLKTVIDDGSHASFFVNTERRGQGRVKIILMESVITRLKSIFIVLLKGIFILLSWILACAALSTAKKSLIEEGASSVASAVVWMALPVATINAFVVFYKGKVLRVKCLEKLFLKLRLLFKTSDDSLILWQFFLSILQISLFLIFLILTFFGSYQTMWGLHYLIVGDIWVAFLGSLRFLLGLFVCFLSNYYFKS